MQRNLQQFCDNILELMALWEDGFQDFESMNWQVIEIVWKD